MTDVTIIGCGVIGAATAYFLSQHNCSVTILEKENDIADATTKANSGIVHAGYDPEPGSMMAKLNVKGAKMTKELCEKLSVPYDQCGSLVLAFTKKDTETIRALYERGLENGVEELFLLTPEEVYELEPNVTKDITGALYAKTAGVVGAWEYAIALAETAAVNGVKVETNAQVVDIDKFEGGYLIRLADGRTHKTRYVVNAAGVYSDKIHNMVAKPVFTITPDRGEYVVLDKEEGGRVNSVIFQCPDENGKGVLVTKVVHGNLLVGPNNERVQNPEDNATTKDGLAFVRGLALKSVPNVDFSKSIRNFAGMRANSDKMEFQIFEPEDAPGFINLAAIKSPGLTSAPAIGEMAVELLKKAGLEAEKKETFVDTREHIVFTHLSQEEKTKLIIERPEYGHVICRCETVTEGEIRDAIRRPIQPRSIDAIKRRCGAGLGRCQGGFCSPRILEILTQETGMLPTEVDQDKLGSFILTGETKEGDC